LIFSTSYRVYNKLGYDFLEKIYENAMMIEFRIEVGLLLNFVPKPEFKRKAFDNLRKWSPARHRSRSGEAGGSAGIGPPWRDSFGEFSGLRKPGLGQGENLRPN
jgi:hypothetical protein